MSFSSEVKNEICHIGDDQPSCCNLAELAALIQICGSIHISGRRGVSLRINTENPSVARRIFTLKNFTKYKEIVVRRKQRLRKNNSYYLVLSNNRQAMRVLLDTGIIRKQDGGVYGLIALLTKHHQKEML